MPKTEALGFILYLYNLSYVFCYSAQSGLTAATSAAFTLWNVFII